MATGKKSAIKSVMPCKRYRIKPSAGASVTRHCSAASSIIHHLPRDTIVIGAEVDLDADGAQRVRLSSPAGWLGADDLYPAEPAPSLLLDWATFEERHQQVAPGDHYGLEFPFTIAMLRESGPRFLTAAFRAAGSLSADNEVAEIVALEPIAIPGASERAFLTVAYARNEPGLHTKLFVKFPPADVLHKFGLSRLGNGEVEMQRLSRRRDLPVKTAKYYYGDHSARTTNYILITERIPFATPPIEPAYKKGYDHQVPYILEHYRILAKSLAYLVAAHKTGELGHDLEDIFPFGRAARNFDPIDNAETVVDRLIDFISRIAPQLFISEARDPAFLQRWRDDLLFGLSHKDMVIDYLHRDADYTGLCHPNLNIDNAWYWRDEAGELQAGLLDWGGAGQMSMAQALSGMLMMPEPEMHLQIVQDVLATFANEYERKSGLALDPEELTFQYKASVFSTAIGTILALVVDVLFLFSEDDYRTMEDRFDSRLQDSGMAAGIIWIDNMLREWLEDVTPGDACRQIVAQGHRHSHPSPGQPNAGADRQTALT